MRGSGWEMKHNGCQNFSNAAFSVVLHKAEVGLDQKVLLDDSDRARQVQ
jgi:hypothetical protein